MSERMDTEKRVAAEAVMTALIKTRTSFFKLYRAANIAAGYPEYDQHTPCYRLADRFLQKNRKAGLIKPERYGGVVTWIPTQTP